MKVLITVTVILTLVIYGFVAVMGYEIWENPKMDVWEKVVCISLIVIGFTKIIYDNWVKTIKDILHKK